jgi:ABC-type phosphate/phosphonate transport system substrate-binding protein
MGLVFRLTYYPWITQTISGPQLAAAINTFKDILLPALDSAFGTQVRLDVLPEMDVSDQIADVSSPPASGIDGTIALMNPVGYALAHQATPAVRSIVVIRRKLGTVVGPTYKAQIYCNALTGITSIAQLRLKTFAFGSPQSTSNFLVPAHLLWRKGLHPMNAFSALVFSGGHDKVAKAVYEGRVDAGAGHDGVIVDLAGKPGYSNAAERLKWLEWSEEIPSDPIAAHVPDAPVLKQLQAALLSIAKPNDNASPGNQAIYGFWGTTEGLEGIGADGYQSLLSYLPPLGLRPDDLLKRW